MVLLSILTTYILSRCERVLQFYYHKDLVICNDLDQKRIDHCLQYLPRLGRDGFSISMDRFREHGQSKCIPILSLILLNKT